jgi:hypothetical protein
LAGLVRSVQRGGEGVSQPVVEGLGGDDQQRCVVESLAAAHEAHHDGMMRQRRQSHVQPEAVAAVVDSGILEVAAEAVGCDAPDPHTVVEDIQHQLRGRVGGVPGPAADAGVRRHVQTAAKGGSAVPHGGAGAVGQAVAERFQFQAIVDARGAIACRADGRRQDGCRSWLSISR